MERISYVSLNHIYRKCNMVADSFAKNSLNYAHGLVELDSIPVYPLRRFRMILTKFLELGALFQG